MTTVQPLRLLAEERRSSILETLEKDGRVTVGQLVKRFGVSPVTIRADLDALAELTRLLPASSSLTSLELTRQVAVLSGQAEPAGPLLRAIDSSASFAGSKFTVPLVRSGSVELFRIHADRKEARR